MRALRPGHVGLSAVLTELRRGSVGRANVAWGRQHEKPLLHAPASWVECGAASVTLRSCATSASRQRRCVGLALVAGAVSLAVLALPFALGVVGGDHEARRARWALIPHDPAEALEYARRSATPRSAPSLELGVDQDVSGERVAAGHFIGSLSLDRGRLVRVADSGLRLGGEARRRFATNVFARAAAQ